MSKKTGEGVLLQVCVLSESSPWFLLQTLLIVFMNCASTVLSVQIWPMSRRLKRAWCHVQAQSYLSSQRSFFSQRSSLLLKRWQQCNYLVMQNACPPVGDSFGDPVGRLFWQPIKVNDIKWNFEKFLAGPDGKPVMRWHPSVTMASVREDVRRYILGSGSDEQFN